MGKAAVLFEQESGATCENIDATILNNTSLLLKFRVCLRVCLFPLHARDPTSVFRLLIQITRLVLQHCACVFYVMMRYSACHRGCTSIQRSHCVTAAILPFLLKSPALSLRTT